MKICFFTICDSEIQSNSDNSRNLDFAGFVNSFKKFHPEIHLKVFSEDMLHEMGLNYYNAKGPLGLLLARQGYDLVVNVDSDHYWFDRCDEILSADYDVAAPANFNITNNLVGIKVSSGITGNGKHDWIVNEVEFLQGGIIASPNIKFWEHYAYATKKHFDKFVCFENDVLNLIAHTSPYKIKVLDGHYDYRYGGHTQWYGCSIIGKEKSCYMENGKVMCDGKPVKAYHFAHGSAKKKYTDIFSPEVCEFIKTII